MNISQLIKNTLKEAQELMTSKTVVGEPIKTDTHTVIPVSKVMFGFGGGGAEGDEKGKKGNGQGVGGGWSIEPVAFVVCDFAVFKFSFVVFYIGMFLISWVLFVVIYVQSNSQSKGPSI